MSIDNFTGHISQRFDDELDAVKGRLTEMGGIVEQQVGDAIAALLNADVALAERVVKKDKSINKLEVAIDEDCALILARRQPAARDLRFVLSIIKTTTDLERIGDEADKMATQAISLSEEGKAPHGYVEIRHIGQHVSRMLSEALDCFVRQDVELALKVAQEDKAVDVEYGSALRAMMTYMMEDPRSITRVMSIMWSLRALERIGDHARNIAEHVIYMVQGDDVRHLGLKKMAEKVKQR
ncbi:MAG: phosphate signaling complex protein PhoU [Gammaproteobacteria bacterium]|nr:phosphate signaling complex protein PhoU [Gammaproteobacteria bacterium]NNM10833.1 phosphate signaling complex protein PhoU [Pseudomonadales bacterium]RZV50446.1 MAG: phosphate signaling complex protein PhoU [Pseudomonadales bacterium]